MSKPQGGRSVIAARLDGQVVTIAAGAANLPLHWDGREHRAEVVLGPAPPITSMAG